MTIQQISHKATPNATRSIYPQTHVIAIPIDITIKHCTNRILLSTEWLDEIHRQDDKRGAYLED
ncbi:hypothetical protein KSZ_19690 [Dictyobacter formicarum]|uniref:Uncharacterized protein n=1 Tax=Dictyobacter formicarum TaxID=2778368 RepID=A0ABQ3VE80_9CHLR|nr:hypothetical protein KSZ_19690 [Dictyobacter formicarum]